MIVGLGIITDSWLFIFAGLVIPIPYLIYIKIIEERELETRFSTEYFHTENQQEKYSSLDSLDQCFKENIEGDKHV